jgi:hypothetical protein
MGSKMEPPRMVRESSCGFDSRYEDPAIVKFNADILRQKLLEVDGPPVWYTPDELYLKTKYAGMKPWEIPFSPSPPETPSGTTLPATTLQKSIEEERDPSLPTPRPYDSPPHIWYKADSYSPPIRPLPKRHAPKTTILPIAEDVDYEYELLTASQQPSIWHDYPIEAHLEWYTREGIPLPDSYVKREQKPVAETQAVREKDDSQKCEQKENTASSKQNSQHNSRRTKRKRNVIVLSETSTNHIRKRPCHQMTTRSRDGSKSPNASC